MDQAKLDSLTDYVDFLELLDRIVSTALHSREESFLKNKKNMEEIYDFILDKMDNVE